jgi:non-heme chloroperoxidase
VFGGAAGMPNVRAGVMAPQLPATPFVETADGSRLAYQDWGTGRSVVFVHGGQLGAAMWEYQLLELVDHGLRCIAYDRRGCGRSSHPWHGYDADSLADDLAALIDQLGLHEVALVGHSNGCGDIARYLSRHGSSRIARVALLAPTTPFLLKTPDNPNGVDKSVFDQTVAALSEDRPRFFAAGASPFFGVGLPNVSVSPEMMQWGVGLALQSSPRAAIAMTRTFAETDFRPDMKSFTVPTLVVHGAGDALAPLDLTGRRTAELVPGSRLEIYETGHGLFITEKERLNRDLLAFIAA